MAKTYTATKKISCWKQHRCAQCGSLFRYAFERKVVGSAPTPERATKNLEVAITKTLATDSNVSPCPQCGAVQPDMMAQSKRRALLWILLATFFLGGLLFIFGAGALLPASTTAWILALFGAAMAAWTWLVLARNPNPDPRSNLAKAATAVSNGTLALDEVRNDSEASRVRAGSAVGLTTIVTLGLAVCALPFAELVRVVSGWPLNPDFHFPVVGPGDTSTFYFPETITAVKSTWNGVGGGRIANGASLPLETESGLHVTSHTDSWGSTIRVKSSEKNSSFTPWVDVQAPAVAALAGKRLDLKLSVHVTYPAMEASGSTWRERSRDISRDTTLALATPGAGRTYETLWYFGTLAGLMGIICVAFFNRRRLAKVLGSTLNSVLPSPAAPTAKT
jgi:hypothetical protein